MDVASAYKDYIQVGFSRLQQRFHCLSKSIGFYDIGLLADVCFNHRINTYPSYHINISLLVSIRLYYYYILLSSADCLYIIIYIGHIADCSKPYRHRLESASANISYWLVLLHRLVSQSTVLSVVYLYC